jgi:hypothetical protein
MNYPGSKKGIELGAFLRLDIIILILIIVLPYVLFPGIGYMVMLITFATLFSRATSLYDNMKVEFHSLLIIALAHTHGAAAGIFVAIASAPLQNKVGQTLGSFQKPPWIMVDCIELALLSVVVSFVPTSELFFYGMLAIIVLGNIIVGGFRVLFFNDPISRRIPLSMVNIMVNYLLLQKFLERALVFVA